MAREKSLNVADYLNQDTMDKDNVLFKISELDLDALLTEYGKDNNYGEYDDYEVYKNYSLSKGSWIDFIEVKYKSGSSKDIDIKYFGVVVLQGYLCSLDEIADSNNLYFEAYLEDLLKTSMVKSLKYDYIQIQEQEKLNKQNNQESEVKEKVEEEPKEEVKEESKKDVSQEEPDKKDDGIINEKYLI